MPTKRENLEEEGGGYNVLSLNATPYTLLQLCWSSFPQPTPFHLRDMRGGDTAQRLQNLENTSKNKIVSWALITVGMACSSGGHSVTPPKSRKQRQLQTKTLGEACLRTRRRVPQRFHPFTGSRKGHTVDRLQPGRQPRRLLESSLSMPVYITHAGRTP